MLNYGKKNLSMTRQIKGNNSCVAKKPKEEYQMGIIFSR